MLPRKRKLSDLASLLSLSRCFVVRYMRWATSSMAHNLKNRPRFISVRISKLKETERTFLTFRRNGVLYKSTQFVMSEKIQAQSL